MRPRVLAYLCLFFCAAIAAHAQEQDPGLKLQTRNANVAPILFQNKTYLVQAPYGGTHGANVGTFYFDDHVRTKEFSTHAASGVNKFWAGDVKYDAKTANLGTKTVIPNATKVYATKTSDTKTARESGKESATRAATTREYRGRGVSQDRLDREGPDALKGANPVGSNGDLHPMTIDEVRTLLNKNK
ncbi:MAG: hypothetical protein WCD79_05290 [Chthoniobacteraceae bacterium]